MSHIIWLKVTKFQQPLLGVEDEKPEGGQKAPPPPAEDRVKSHENARAEWEDSHGLVFKTRTS